MVSDWVMVTGPRSPGSSTSISPPASVCACAAAKVKQGNARVHGLESLPEDAETQVRAACGPLVPKSADTLNAAFSVKTQLPVPLQAPVQPLKTTPSTGVAMSVTCVLLGKLALHIALQSMPAGKI